MKMSALAFNPAGRPHTCNERGILVNRMQPARQRLTRMIKVCDPMERDEDCTVMRAFVRVANDDLS